MKLAPIIEEMIIKKETEGAGAMHIRPQIKELLIIMLMILVLLCFAGQINNDRAFAADRQGSPVQITEDEPGEDPEEPVEIKEGWIEEDGAVYY